MLSSHVVAFVVVVVIHLSNAGATEFRRVCYFTNWSQYRPGAAKFLPENIDPSLCSHIMYAFAKLTNNQLTTIEWNDEDLYQRVNNLKLINPSLKTLLSVGGATAGTSEMSTMLSSATNRQQFINSSITFLRSRNFDGLDLDFEYPSGGNKPLFTLLIQEFKAAANAEALRTGKNPLLLTAAVPAGKSNIDNGYEVQKISQYLDFINLMSYDLHGSWDSVTGHNSPLYALPTETGWNAYLNVNWSAEYWVSLGTPRDKLVIGMPAYGRGFTLSSPSTATGIGAPASGPCSAGTYTREAGFLAYYEVCQKLMISSSRRVWSNEQQVPYLIYESNQWIGYDDVQSLTGKVLWAQSKMFGGWMVWSLDLDDFSGSFCGDQKYPLITALNSALNSASASTISSSRTSTSLYSKSSTRSSQPTSTRVTTKLMTTSMSLSFSKQSSSTTTTTAKRTVTSTPVSTTKQSNGFTCNTSMNFGYFPDPVSCSYFYRCVYGIAYHFTCPTGTLWDDAVLTCNYPYGLSVARRLQCQLA